MRSIKIVGLCLVAVFAFSAITAASASAAPTLTACVKLTAKPYTGKYLDKACTIAASPTEIAEGKKNKYESKEFAGTLAGKSKGTKITFKNKNGETVTVVCSKDTVKLVALGDGFYEVTITFEKCTTTIDGKKASCSVAPFKPEVIDFGGLTANENAEPFGVLLAGALDITCGSETNEVSGVVVGKVENTSKGVNLVFGVSGGHQEENELSFGEEGLEGPFTLEANGSEATLESKEEIKAKGVTLAG